MLVFLRAALLSAATVTLLAAPAPAQPQEGVSQTTPPTAGRLRYEATRRLDNDKAKITVTKDGQPVDMSAEEIKLLLPETVSFIRVLVFSGNYAKEERENPGLPPVKSGVAAGKVSGRQPGIFVSAVDNQYLSLADRTVSTVTTIGDAEYLSPARPVPAPPAGWQEQPQTRKIAGYLCHKVTAPFKKETYTLWVTTELPFTYSPVRELTPARGVVLALSSDQEEYTATKLTPELVAEAAVRPSPQARPVAEAELKELRAKASADMRQRMLEQYSGASQR